MAPETPGVPAAAAPGASAPGLALAGLSLSVLLSALGTSSANIALPALARSFDAPFREVQWVVLAYLLAVTMSIVSIGRLGDMFGRRRLLVAGIAAFSAASLACAAASSLWALVAARAAQGIGGAVMMAIPMAMIGAIVPKERTGRAMGLLAAMSAAGTALGPSVGGALTAWLGWEAVFLTNVPLGVLAIVLASRGLLADRRNPPDRRPPFDVAGALVLAASLGAFTMSSTVGPEALGTYNLILVAGAAAGIFAFVRIERRSASPLVPISLFADRTVGVGLATSVVVMTVMMTTMVVGPFYLLRSLGLETEVAGLVMASGPVVVALAGVPAGRFADRFGARRASLVGLAVLGLGTVLLAGIPAAAGVWGYVAALVVATAGYALFQTANNTAVMAATNADRRGVVSGLLNLARNLGLVAGASAMGAVFAGLSGGADIASAGPEGVAAGMRATFQIAAVLVAAALALASATKPRAA